jgi:hypothetical protein
MAADHAHADAARSTTLLLEAKVSDALQLWDEAVKAGTIGKDQPQGGGLEELSCSMAAPVTQSTTSRRLHCRPWDYGDFASRLRTFTPLKWFAKPASWSPLQCARHGWSCSAKDQLLCDCCGVGVVYGGRQFASRGALDTAHSQLCPWRGNSCPLSFLHFPLLSEEEMRAGIRARLMGFVKYSDAQSELGCALPALSPPDEFGNALGGSDDLCGCLGEVANMLREGETGDPRAGTLEARGTMLMLAMCGWRVAEEKADQTDNAGDSDPPSESRLLMQCSICDRHLGSWNFVQISYRGGSDVTTSGRKRRLSDSPASMLDPVAEHHSYCPWAHTQPSEREEGILGLHHSGSPGNEVKMEVQPGWQWALRTVRAIATKIPKLESRFSASRQHENTPEDAEQSTGVKGAERRPSSSEAGEPVISAELSCRAARKALDTIFQ